VLGIMTVAVLVFIVTNAGKEAQRAREKREAAPQAQPPTPPTRTPDERGPGGGA
jgi:hypothetical protein